MDNQLYFTLAFIASIALIAVLRVPARRWGWVDRPGAHKRHREPVPVIGGVAMYAVFALMVWLAPERPMGWEVLLAAMGMLTLIGVYDDVRPASPAGRIVCQAGAVLLMALAGGPVIVQLGDLFGLGAVALGMGAVWFTLFAVVGVINAINMSDGLDGLAAGLALVAVIWLIVLGLTGPGQHQAELTTLIVLAAVILGFLVFNLRHPWRARASVFMGDAGSTALGLVIGWFLVQLSQGDERVMAPMTAVWILAVPLLDAVTLMIRRIRAGRSPFAADRHHLHHLLQGLGWSDARTTAVLLLVAAVIGGLGAAAWWLDVPEHLQFYTFVALFLLYYRITARAWARLDRYPATKIDYALIDLQK